MQSPNAKTCWLTIAQMPSAKTRKADDPCALADPGFSTTTHLLRILRHAFRIFGRLAAEFRYIVLIPEADETQG